MSRKDETIPHGPGNTFWYISDDGEIIRCRWNDSGWCSATGVYLSDNKKISEWQILKLVKEAYEMGMKDQKVIIKNALGVS